MRYIYFLLLTVVFTSCAKEFRNPYDPATPPDIWMPKAFKLDTLGTNALRLTWQQDELHIDGFAIHKTTNGQMKEILLPLDSLRFTDTQAVDTSSDAVCPELSYKVMARAGNNRSLEIGTTSGIRIPLSTPAIAGTDILVTDTATTVQLNAQAANPGERGQWTIVSGTGGSFSNQNAHNSNFTGTPCTDYVLRWTKSGCTETYDEVSVKFQKAITTANAGANQTYTDGTTQSTLNANNLGAGESGIWTIISGTGGILENLSIPNTLFTGQSCTDYVLRWTITDVCNSSVDEMNVSFQKATTSANAGANQTISSSITQVNLAANAPATGETGTWTIVNGTGGSFSNINASNATFTGNACTNYILQWSIQGPCSTSADQISINFLQTPNTANAGSDQTATNLTVNLAANAPANGVAGTWSIVSGTGGSFSNVTSSNSTFTGVWGQTYTLKWTLLLYTCNTISFDEVIITFPLATPHTCGAINIHNPALSYGSMTDQQGNAYKTIVIGTQEWMAENLKTTAYRNGDAIANVTDNATWGGLTTGAWCYYNNNSQYNCPYGKLYNGYAVADPRNVCPTGWHVPNNVDWSVLQIYLQPNSVTGAKMKSIGTQYWANPNTGATNESGFSCLPAGHRIGSGLFQTINSYGNLWSSSEYTNGSGQYKLLTYADGPVYTYDIVKSYGFSIRCVRD